MECFRRTLRRCKIVVGNTAYVRVDALSLRDLCVYVRAVAPRLIRSTLTPPSSCTYCERRLREMIPLHTTCAVAFRFDKLKKCHAAIRGRIQQRMLCRLHRGLGSTCRGQLRSSGCARSNPWYTLLLPSRRQGLDRYWMEPLMSLTKPEARRVAMQLSNANKLGYVSTRGGPVGKGSLLEFVLTQKEKHPTKVRCHIIVVCCSCC